MRVLMLGRSEPDLTIDGVATALARRHEVIFHDPAVLPGNAWRLLGHKGRRVAQALVRLWRGHESALAQEQILRTVERLRPDWVFVLNAGLLTPPTVDWIRSRTNAVVTLWYMDHLAAIQRWEFVYAPYTAKFYVDPYLCNLERDRLLHDNVFHVSMGFDETTLGGEESRSDELEPYRCDVATYGNVYPWRLEMLRELRSLDLRVYGAVPRWLWFSDGRPFQRRSVFAHDKVLAMRACKVAISTASPGSVSGINKRTYELAGMGVFQLSDNPGLEREFDPEREVPRFSNAKDLARQVEHYLDRPSIREEIAARARSRAIASYTFGHRLDAMIELVPELKGKAGGTLVAKATLRQTTCGLGPASGDSVGPLPEGS